MARDNTFRHVAIAAVRYHSPLLTRTSGIEEVATRITRHLEDAGIFNDYREIYFIAHSMGGLVVKRTLVKLNGARELEKLRRVRAVLYISTPAQGANLADLASWLSANPQLDDMAPADLNSYLQSLENDWQDLIRQRGAELFPRSYCAYETRPTLGGMVVNRIYAATSCDQNPFPVDEDHVGIVKPGSADADIYVWVRARIHEAGEMRPVRKEGVRESETYRVEIPIVITSPAKNLVSDVMLGYSLSNGDAVSPVHFALHVQVTNLSTVKPAVTRYAVEASANDTGPWIALLPMRIENNYKIYMTWAGLDRAAEVQLLDGILDWVIPKGNFQPHETRKGWAFFEQRKLTVSEIKYFRVRIYDTTGIVSTQIIRLPQASTLAERSFQNVHFKVIAVRDITKFQFRYFHTNPPQ